MALPFSWPGKKESGEAPLSSKLEFPEELAAAGGGPSPPPGAAPAGPPSAESLDQILGRYSQLGRMLEQANQQVLHYLLHRDAQAAGPTPLDARLAAIAQRLESLDKNAPTDAAALEKAIGGLQAKIEQMFSAVPAARAVETASSAAAAPALGEASLKAAFGPLQERFDQLDAQLRWVAERAAAVDALKEAFIPTLVKVRDGLSEQHVALGNGIHQLQQQLEAGVQSVMAQLRPPEPAPEPSSGGFPAVGGDWQDALLGYELASNGAIQYECQRLLAGVLHAEAAACSLVGCLLLFRAAAVERMPPLLKDIGEAYYRWEPRTSGKPNEMEKALIAWLQRACDEAGISNTIELVHPGERFDSTRHTASQRGVEITEVLGWIVLRDNGKVYTKASVAVK